MEPRPGRGKFRTALRTVALVAALIAVVSATYLLLLRRRAQLPPPEARRWPTVITALAGVGAPGLAEGRGHEAAFSDPFGVAVDRAGNTYLSDAGDNNVIWRIGADGRASVVAGGSEGFADGDGRNAAFNTPSGIALDEAGNLLVADTTNNAIRRVTPAGAVTTIAGGGDAAHVDGRGREARFNGPAGIAVAPDGSAIVADTYNDCIRRIAPDGEVTTIAGGAATGFQDGTAGEALFDTPSGVAVGRDATIYVADTGNDAIRRIDRNGRVTTLGRPGGASGSWQAIDLFRPVGIAVERGRDTHADLVVATDGAGRVVALPDTGEVVTLAGWRGASPAPTPEARVRIRNPTGIAAAGDGTLRVADSDSYVVFRLTRPGDVVPAADIDFTPVPWLTASTLRIATFPWPFDPQLQWHEVAATLGEARGSVGGDGRERLHSGIDVRAPVGTIVRAVHDEKVERPTGATGFGSVNESLRVGVVSYVHVRVGRTARGTEIDPSRFLLVRDNTGVPVRIRVRRGTRIRIGDALGTVNNFAHVHLSVGPRADEINPLSLPLVGFHDDIRPTIPPNGITLYSESGEAVAAPRKGPVDVTGRVAIVVEAFDQVDGNDRRRRLGVYRLGYQLFGADGRPAPGFEKPRMTIEFDRLPDAADGPHLIYGEGSGITVYGNRTTRFRYIVTNSLHEGRVSNGLWDTTTLPAGEYRLRVFAGDSSGNETTRDLPVRIAGPAKVGTDD